MKFYPMSQSHQRVALPLHILAIKIFGLLAFISILGGIIAVILNATSETKIDIFGAHITTGHVGVALISIGLIMTFFTVRTIVRSQRELAALPENSNSVLSSIDIIDESEHSKRQDLNKFPKSDDISICYQLYDALDYFVACINDNPNFSGAGTFINDNEVFLISFNHDGEVTRQLTAKIDNESLWLHCEVRGMVLLRKSNDNFPKGGITLYEFADYPRLDWSDKSKTERKGNKEEFLRSSHKLLGAIHRCSEAKVPVQEWRKKLY